MSAGIINKPKPSTLNRLKDSAYAFTKTALATHNATLIYNSIKGGFSGTEIQPYDHEGSMNFSFSAGGAYLGLEIAGAIIKSWQINEWYSLLSGRAQGVADVGLMLILGLAGYIAGGVSVQEIDPILEIKKLTAVFIVTFGAGRIFSAYRPPDSTVNVIGSALSEVIGLWISGAASEIPQGTSTSEYVATMAAFTVMLATGTFLDLVRAGYQTDRISDDDDSAKQELLINDAESLNNRRPSSTVIASRNLDPAGTIKMPETVFELTASIQ